MVDLSGYQQTRSPAGAERHQLAGGHLLTGDQLAAVYAWLAAAGQ